ncbi:late embryogenesis abundant protein-related / LEA protein-related protein [Prunus dulcis]|uniref:Late embryogenesis abundant protein-related / LEA protein-related protein n=1 Tax=Prunus dulcis TaxID=3755 RepID=A0A4Y1S043_PRUDU|nr:late embryogenesis abundant protein-related / LEA protein-related protein [Prunus dulcis]
MQGPALVVDVPRDSNITAEVMKSLNIPKGTRRVLFKTLNTDRRLMHRKEFDSSFVGFTEDGAKWVVDNTDIKLVGTDYFSIATYDEAIPAHVAFLRGREIIPVEGLKLDDIQPGNYSVHCLPLRLLGAEGHQQDASSSNEMILSREIVSRGVERNKEAVQKLGILLLILWLAFSGVNCSGALTHKPYCMVVKLNWVADATCKATSSDYNKCCAEGANWHSNTGFLAQTYQIPLNILRANSRVLLQMAHFKMQVVVPILLLMLMAAAEAKTPPGIAKNPSNARCLIKKYKHCYNLVHVCPKFCPDKCTVECVSCKPICSGGSSPPPPVSPTPSPAPPTYYSPPPPQAKPTPPPSPPTPTPSTPSPTPPTTAPTLPTPSPSPSPPPPAPHYQSPPPTPSPPTPSPPTSPPPSTPTPSPPTSSSPSPTPSTSPKRPSARTKCDQPGAVCQDPRFIGGDGITFYFHGKKDRDFCLLSDPNLHINAHFIGRRNHNMKRDFTWVQSIAILFGKHQLFLGAQKTATWDDSTDRLALSFDGEPITLPESKAPGGNPQGGDTNNVMVEVEGSFRITAKVVPITEEDSRIHNYGITKDNTFAHLDLGFKFFSLSNQVSGVLGQTYRPHYVSRVNIGANMPVMGGDRDFETSSFFATDCAIARFNNGSSVGSGSQVNSLEGLELPSLSCASGMDGQGVVCKR